MGEKKRKKKTQQTGQSADVFVKTKNAFWNLFFFTERQKTPILFGRLPIKF